MNAQLYIKEYEMNKLTFLRGYLVHVFHFKNAHYMRIKSLKKSFPMS
ncbi:MAG: hypothetical protein ACI9XO_004706 [Paraglaciecola sp.]|jgi:hypothetical protein